MEFLIGTVVGSAASLITATLIYQADIDRMNSRCKELLETLRRFNNEYNRQ